MAVTSLTASVSKALQTLSAVTALIGAGTASRIRADGFEQEEVWPAILVEVDAEDHLGSLDSSGKLVQADVNLVCRSNTRATTDALVVALRDNGGNGLAGLPSYVDSDLKAIRWEDTANADTPKKAAGEQRFVDTNITLTVWYYV